MKSIIATKRLNSLAICVILVIISGTLQGISNPAYGQWTKHIIDENLSTASGLYVADMDGDDTLDVVASGYAAGDVVWYEAPSWTKHVIDANLYSARHVYVADMDGDNDLDVVAVGYAAGDVVWYESTFIVGVAE